MPIHLVIHGHFYQPPGRTPGLGRSSGKRAPRPFTTGTRASRRSATYPTRAPASSTPRDASRHRQQLRDDELQLRPHAAVVGDGAARTSCHPSSPQTGRVWLASGTQRHCAGLQPYDPASGHTAGPTHPDPVGSARVSAPLPSRSEALWLPETAVDAATLDLLIDAGMQYVILFDQVERRG